MRSLPLVLACSMTHALAAPPEAPRPDPARQEVPLPAQPGWDARLAYESDVGIWTCGAFKAFPRNGHPELFGLDDKGRCIVLSCYSGNWTPYFTVEDRRWLGAFASLDLDTRRSGDEFYVGGQNGNLYQVQAHGDGTFDTQVIARFPAEEIHTAVSGDLDPARPGRELLVFTHPGHVYDVRPRPDGNDTFDAPRIATLPGRVRQALVLPAADAASENAPREIAAVCRSGEVLLLRLEGGTLEAAPIADEPIGWGRLALRRAAAGRSLVLYATRDDGVIVRLEREADGAFAREEIYHGPQGPRGIAAGRFHADAAVEAVAVFGYSSRVEMLSRRPGEPWRVETVFEDRDKGHWLETVELDGRNATDELVCSGYGKRIVVLSRPPGFGKAPGVPVAPAVPESARKTASGAGDRDAPHVLPRAALTVALDRTPPETARLSPLRYQGGFETKSLLFETLTTRGPDGRVAPGLATSWQVSKDGLEVTLELRRGARFHDGQPADARAVALHFRRWIGLPEHGWLGASRHVREVRADGDTTLVLSLARPWPVLDELCAWNPCAVQSPAAFDRQGEYQGPLGTGPFALHSRPEGRMRLRRVTDGALVDLVFPPGGADESLALLRTGEVDLVQDGGYERVLRSAIGTLSADPSLRVESAPGSLVVYLSFRLQGATADVELRRAIAAALDRDALVHAAELGHADPCTAFAAPCVAAWPRGRAVAGEAFVPPGKPLLLLALEQGRESALAPAIARQCRDAGIAVEAEFVDAAEYAKRLQRGAFDLRLETTWGLPYDPWLSLAARFLPPPAEASAANDRDFGVDPGLRALVEAAAKEADPTALEAHYPRIQERMDRDALVVPLYVPRRLRVARSDVTLPPQDADLYRLVLTDPLPGGSR